MNNTEPNDQQATETAPQKLPTNEVVSGDASCSPPSPLKTAEELFSLLQGNVPEGFHIPPNEVPNLSQEQAWTIVLYLGNLHRSIKDHVERCGVCGTIYDSHESGDCLDYGDKPYHFCDECCNSNAYLQKHDLNPENSLSPDDGADQALE